MKQKKSKWLPLLCNVLGTLILISILILYLPAILPRLFGGDVFEVVSGSMEPAIPVGSAVFVTYEDAENLLEGDIVAFYSETSVITHRVVKNQTVEGKLITKGDANGEEDMNPVKYASVIGKVWLTIPVVGALMTLLTGRIGKIYMLIFALCGILFYVLAGKLRKNYST